MTFRNTLLLLALAVCCYNAPAQSSQQLLVNPVSGNVAQPTSEKADSAAEHAKGESKAKAGISTPSQFRVERIKVNGGAELLTIFGRLNGLRAAEGVGPEVPLISVLRDTLSDTNPENDRLRYVWMLTYTRPNLMKRLAAAVPFLYQDVGSQTQAASRPPKPLIDLANPERQTWNHFFWTGMQNIFLDSYGIPLKASTRTYRRNAADYRTGHVFQALSIFDTYENLRTRSRDESELLALAGNDLNPKDLVSDTQTPLIPSTAFTSGEILEMRARLILSGKMLGGLLGPETFASTVAKRTVSSVDNRGHNWEMLRQRAEAEGLYFEPLNMPDGSATHAILWIAKSDLQSAETREFHSRFLNIANPWKDNRLRNWNGYSRKFFFDSDDRPVSGGSPYARAVDMIPLALYGLDHPKIPALIIDFRDGLNPKKREMSRRVFSDLAKNIFSLSNFGNLPYFVGKSFYDFATGRRGMDLNQPTRLRSYSELKLLLSFDPSIDASLQNEIERRLQNVSLNPLNNDNQAEMQLAQQQYEALVEYARRPDGLAAKVERDRGAEMVPLKHGASARFFFTLGNVLTFGRYVHRENVTPDLTTRLELARRLERQTQFLAQVAQSSPQTEVAWDIRAVKRSLQILAEDGSAAGSGAAKSVAAIFQRTNDAEAQQLCLEALSKINNRTARAELLRIYEREHADSELRAQLAERLRKAVATDARIKPSEARTLLNQVGTP